ncbi:MAG: hypothetical protein CMJ35_08575 [Phycisphaerae bacterium]|nr:hypothetical protein [Phycisphaerae bacterium]
MRKTLIAIAPTLKLTRVTTAFGAVANLWFVILWTRFNPEELSPSVVKHGSLPLLLAAGLIAGVGLYAFGTSLNDLLDVHRDRALNKQTSPIVDGSASIELAVCLVAATLMLAILGSVVFGTEAILMTLLLAVAVLIFNALGKFVPGIGMLLLALIYAGHMLIPDLWIRFLLPVWLVMTHALIVAALAQHLGRRSPPISKRAAAFASLGWLACTLALAALAYTRRTNTDGYWPDFVPITAILYPLGFAALFAIMIWRRYKKVGTGPALGEKITRYGAIWPALYACGWLAGTNLWTACAIMAALTITGFLVMTVLRELYALIEHPVGYRL